jgi:hypothetical protein
LSDSAAVGTKSERAWSRQNGIITALCSSMKLK